MLVPLDDATDPRQAQRELQARTVQLVEAQRIAALGSWEWRVADDAVVWSEELFRIYGLEPVPRPLDFESFLRRVHPGDRAETRRAVEWALRGQGGLRHEHRIVRPSGEVRTLRTQAELLRDEHGRPERMLGVCQDVTDDVETRRLLERSQRELRALAAHLESVREDERARIAREVHDGLGQLLTAIKLDLGWAARRLAASPQASEASDRLVATGQLVDDAIRCVRRIAEELHPAVLEAGRLGPAIEWLANELARRSEIACRVELALDESRVPDEVRSAVFRIAQEALTNVARHADARSVTIRLVSSERGLELSVRDDGCGIPGEQLSSLRALGLIGMRQRAAHLRGVVRFERATPRGTLVRVEIPLEPEASKRTPGPRGGAK